MGKFTACDEESLSGNYGIFWINYFMCYLIKNIILVNNLKEFFNSEFRNIPEFGKIFNFPKICKIFKKTRLCKANNLYSNVSLINGQISKIKD